MILLIVGLFLFFTAHFVPAFPGLRNQLVTARGERPYKAVFSLLSLIGLLLVVFGFSRSDFISLWDPVSWSRQVILYVMPVSILLIVSADMPGHIRRILRHPMSYGIMLWSGVHLLANGDLASTLIFASFGSFVLFSVLSRSWREGVSSRRRASFKFDLIAVVVSAGLSALIILWAHEFLIGVPVI